MCGRFALATPAESLAEHFQVIEFPLLKPRYNIAPTQPVTAVKKSQGHTGREACIFTWGLVPSWSKDPGMGTRMINARAETVAEKPSFRAPLRYKRCLIPADGFYEWKRAGKLKHPFFVCLESGRPFAFAGLWDHWEGVNGSVIESCTIITTTPNDLMRTIHNRMPVILDPSDYTLWLDPDIQKLEQLTPLFAPRSSKGMIAYPVSTIVNNPVNDSHECIEPSSEVNN